MLNIWIMNHYATDMFEDRAGRHFWFAKKMEALGYGVSVFCASTYLNKHEVVDTGGKQFIVKYDAATPFVFIRVPSYSGNGFARVKNMLGFYLGLLCSAKKYAQLNGAPDVILASSVHPLTMAAGIKIARKFNIPCICEVRDLWPEAIFAFGKAKENSLLGKALLAGEHWIYRNADALIFTKEGDVDYLREKSWTTLQGGDVDLNKCYYINNGVNLDKFDRLIKEEILADDDLNENKFNVVYAGTIRPVNNVGNILDCAKLLSAYSSICFLIYGEGSELQDLKTRLVNENIKNVILKGRVPRKNIPYILSRASVNILNYSQGLYNWSRGNSSNKLFEYMASAKPIISTAKMGYSIIKKNRCGIELENSTPEALANAILRIYKMSLAERNLLGQRARKGVVEFDFDNLTAKLITVINSVKWKK